MDVTVNKLYLYDNIRQLLLVDDNACFCSGDNGPMHKNPILIHKSIDNKVIFRALGPDRTPACIPDGQEVYARIINPYNHTILLEKLCTQGPATGIIILNLNSGDIGDISAGTYNMVIIRTEDFVATEADYYVEKPVFSDMYNNVSMEVQITDQAYTTPIPSIVIEEKDWTPDTIMGYGAPPTRCFYTKRIPGGRVLNHKASVHSFSTFTENFTGKLEVFGSLEESPDPYLDENRWFKIYPNNMNGDIEYRNYTGTMVWSFTQNIMWIKFRLVPTTELSNAGRMKKLIIRS